MRRFMLSRINYFFRRSARTQMKKHYRTLAVLLLFNMLSTTALLFLLLSVAGVNSSSSLGLPTPSTNALTPPPMLQVHQPQEVHQYRHKRLWRGRRRRGATLLSDFYTTPLLFNVDEETPIGQIVAQLPFAHVERVSGSALKYFSFQQRTSSVVVKRRLDFESLSTSSKSTPIVNYVDFELVCIVRANNTSRHQADTSNTNTNTAEQVVPVTIRVRDVNDNPPVFLQPLIQVKFFETNVTGSQRVTLDDAYDADVATPATRISYEIVPSLFSNLFALKTNDDKNFELYNVAPLDHERQSTVLLRVRARDDGLLRPQQQQQHTLPSSLLTLNITVANVNDNAPVFEHATYAVHVHERPTTAKVPLLRVVARDDDREDLLQYSLDEKSSQQFFIDSKSGEIFVAPQNSTEEKVSLKCPNECSAAKSGQSAALVRNRQLTRQRHSISTSSPSTSSCQRVCLLTVVARDNAPVQQEGKAQVRVVLIDDNDHAPQITFRFYTTAIRQRKVFIDNTARVGTVVAVVSVDDADDEGANSMVDVEMTLADNSKNLFVLEALRSSATSGYLGVIKLNDNFHNQRSLYNVTVTARDRGQPLSLQSSKSLEIQIKPPNLYSSEFDQTIYEFFVQDKNLLSTPENFIGRVRARDLDGDEIRYEISAENNNQQNCFVIDRVTGFILISSVCDDHLSAEKRVIEFNVTAREIDAAMPKAPARALVRIKIEADDEEKEARRALASDMQSTTTTNSPVATVPSSPKFAAQDYFFVVSKNDSRVAATDNDDNFLQLGKILTTLNSDVASTVTADDDNDNNIRIDAHTQQLSMRRRALREHLAHARRSSSATSSFPINLRRNLGDTHEQQRARVHILPAEAEQVEFRFSKPLYKISAAAADNSAVVVPTLELVSVNNNTQTIIAENDDVVVTLTSADDSFYSNNNCQRRFPVQEYFSINNSSLTLTIRSALAAAAANCGSSASCGCGGCFLFQVVAHSKRTASFARCHVQVNITPSQQHQPSSSHSELKSIVIDTLQQRGRFLYAGERLFRANSRFSNSTSTFTMTIENFSDGGGGDPPTTTSTPSLFTIDRNTGIVRAVAGPQHSSQLLCHPSFNITIHETTTNNDVHESKFNLKFLFDSKSTMNACVSGVPPPPSLRPPRERYQITVPYSALEKMRAGDLISEIEKEEENSGAAVVSGRQWLPQSLEILQIFYVDSDDEEEEESGTVDAGDNNKSVKKCGRYYSSFNHNTTEEKVDIDDEDDDDDTIIRPVLFGLMQNGSIYMRAARFFFENDQERDRAQQQQHCMPALIVLRAHSYYDKSFVGGNTAPWFGRGPSFPSFNTLTASSEIDMYITTPDLTTSSMLEGFSLKQSVFRVEKEELAATTTKIGQLSLYPTKQQRGRRRNDLTHLFLFNNITTMTTIKEASPPFTLLLTPSGQLFIQKREDFSFAAKSSYKFSVSATPWRNLIFRDQEKIQSFTFSIEIIFHDDNDKNLEPSLSAEYYEFHVPSGTIVNNNTVIGRISTRTNTAHVHMSLKGERRVLLPFALNASSGELSLITQGKGEIDYNFYDLLVQAEFQGSSGQWPSSSSSYARVRVIFDKKTQPALPYFPLHPSSSTPTVILPQGFCNNNHHGTVNTDESRGRRQRKLFLLTQIFAQVDDVDSEEEKISYRISHGSNRLLSTFLTIDKNGFLYLDSSAPLNLLEKNEKIRVTIEASASTGRSTANIDLVKIYDDCGGQNSSSTTSKQKSAMPEFFVEIPALVEVVENLRVGTRLFHIPAPKSYHIFMRQDPPGGTFALDEQNNVIVASSTFDREQRASYNLQLFALENSAATTFSLQHSQIITINLLDENDCAPEITLPARTLALPRSTRAGASILQTAAATTTSAAVISVRDADSVATTTADADVELVENRYVALRDFKLILQLDAAQIPDERFELLLRASDGKFHTQEKILVILVDDDDDSLAQSTAAKKLEFKRAQYFVSVYETQRVGQPIVQISVNDSTSAGAAVEYHIASAAPSTHTRKSSGRQCTASAFDVDRTAGVIVNTQALDADAGADADDADGEESSSENLCELTVLAIYSSTALQVEEEQKEAQHWLPSAAVARSSKNDNGKRGKIFYAHAKVTIKILDVNDNVPQFPQNEYVFIIQEDKQADERGQKVGTVRAYDADRVSRNAGLRYRTDTTAEGVTIDEKTGEIFFVNHHGTDDGGDPTTTFSSNVFVSNGEHEASVKCTIIIIHAQQQQQQEPPPGIEFLQQKTPYAFVALLDELKAGDNVGGVAAHAPSSPMTTSIRYRQKAGWQDERFHVDSNSGIITLKSINNFTRSVILERVILSIEACLSTTTSTIGDDDDNNFMSSCISTTVFMNVLNKNQRPKINYVSASTNFNDDELMVRRHFVVHVDPLTGCGQIPEKIQHMNPISKSTLASIVNQTHVCVSAHMAHLLNATSIGLEYYDDSLLATVSVADRRRRHVVLDVEFDEFSKRMKTAALKDNNRRFFPASVLYLPIDAEVGYRLALFTTPVPLRFTLLPSDDNYWKFDVVAQDVSTYELVLSTKSAKPPSGKHVIVLLNAIDPMTNLTVAQQSIRIIVINTNSYSNYTIHTTYKSLNISEGTPVGSIVYSPAITGSTTDDIRYVIISQNDAQQDFELNSYTGQVVVAHPLDFERQAVYAELDIIAIYHSTAMIEHTLLKISVENENDHRPRFLLSNEHFFVQENYFSTTSPIGQVTVVDDDFPPYNRFSVRMIDGDTNLFSVDSTGRIFVKKPIDAEKPNSNFNNVYTITLEDVDDDQSTTSTTSETRVVHIEIVDENDNAPQFVTSQYEFCLPTPTSTNIVIGRVQAIDLDALSKISYKIINCCEECIDIIDLNETTGELKWLVSSPKPSTPSGKSFLLAFQVQAYDGYYTDVANVSIKFSFSPRREEFEKDENPPVFLNQSLETLEISENLPSGTLVATIAARANDNDRITYSLATDDHSSSCFTIDERTGQIRTSQPLDYENQQQQQFYLTIIAQNKKYSTQKIISIKVKNQNDNAPRFVRQYALTMDEELALGTRVAQFEVNDGDMGQQSRALKFSLKPMTASDDDVKFFSVDADTGILRVARRIDRESLSSSYELQFMAVVHDGEGGEGAWVAQTPVSVTVLDVDDHAPQIDMSRQRALMTTTESNKTIGQIVAIDHDDGQKPVRFQQLSHFDEFHVDPVSGHVTQLWSSVADHDGEGKVLWLRVALTSSSSVLTRASKARVPIIVVPKQRQEEKEEKNLFVAMPLSLSLENNNDDLIVGNLFQHLNLTQEIIIVENCEGNATTIAVGGNFALDYFGNIILKKRRHLPSSVTTTNGTVWAMTAQLRAADGQRYFLQTYIIEQQPPSAAQDDDGGGSTNADTFFEFDSNEYEIVIDENVAIGTNLLTLQLNHSFVAPKFVTFSLEADGQQLPFDISPLDGVLRVSAPVDYEQQHEYRFNVTATTYYSDVQKTITAIVVVKVFNVNDERPVFHNAAQLEDTVITIDQNSDNVILDGIVAVDYDTPNTVVKLEVFQADGAFEIINNSALRVVRSLSSSSRSVVQIRAIDTENAARYSILSIHVRRPSTTTKPDCSEIKLNSTSRISEQRWTTQENVSLHALPNTNLGTDDSRQQRDVAVMYDNSDVFASDSTVSVCRAYDEEQQQQQSIVAGAAIPHPVVLTTSHQQPTKTFSPVEFENSLRKPVEPASSSSSAAAATPKVVIITLSSLESHINVPLPHGGDASSALENDEFFSTTLYLKLAADSADSKSARRRRGIFSVQTATGAFTRLVLDQHQQLHFSFGNIDAKNGRRRPSDYGDDQKVSSSMLTRRILDFSSPISSLNDENDGDDEQYYDSSTSTRLTVSQRLRTDGITWYRIEAKRERQLAVLRVSECKFLEQKFSCEPCLANQHHCATTAVGLVRHVDLSGANHINFGANSEKLSSVRGCLGNVSMERVDGTRIALQLLTADIKTTTTKEVGVQSGCRLDDCDDNCAAAAATTTNWLKILTAILAVVAVLAAIAAAAYYFLFVVYRRRQQKSHDKRYQLTLPTNNNALFNVLLPQQQQHSAASSSSRSGADDSSSTMLGCLYSDGATNGHLIKFNSLTNQFVLNTSCPPTTLPYSQQQHLHNTLRPPPHMCCALPPPPPPPQSASATAAMLCCSPSGIFYNVAGGGILPYPFFVAPHQQLPQPTRFNDDDYDDPNASQHHLYAAIPDQQHYAVNQLLQSHRRDLSSDDDGLQLPDVCFLSEQEQQMKINHGGGGGMALGVGLLSDLDDVQERVALPCASAGSNSSSQHTNSTRLVATNHCSSASSATSEASSTSTQYENAEPLNTKKTTAATEQRRQQKRRSKQQHTTATTLFYPVPHHQQQHQQVKRNQTEQNFSSQNNNNNNTRFRTERL